jgi:hypothetical protein
VIGSHRGGRYEALNTDENAKKQFNEGALGGANMRPRTTGGAEEARARNSRPSVGWAWWGGGEKIRLASGHRKDRAHSEGKKIPGTQTLFGAVR